MELESLHSGQNRDQTGERQNLKKIYVGCRARSLARHKPAMRILVFWFWLSGFLVLVFTSSISGFYLVQFWFLLPSNFRVSGFYCWKKMGERVQINRVMDAQCRSQRHNTRQFT